MTAEPLIFPLSLFQRLSEIGDGEAEKAFFLLVGRGPMLEADDGYLCVAQLINHFESDQMAQSVRQLCAV